LISGNGFDYLLDELSEFQKNCPIEPHKALWFIQGHCAFGDIMLPYFTKVIQLISKNLEINSISKEDRNHWQKRSKIDSYKDLLAVSYRNCLAASQQCDFFDQIKADIENDFGKLS